MCITLIQAGKALKLSRVGRRQIMGPSLLRNILGAAYATRKAFMYASLYPLIALHVVDKTLAITLFRSPPHIYLTVPLTLPSTLPKCIYPMRGRGPVGNVARA